ncbi:zinc-dependent alcohol dehydrogenase [Kribbella antiqua]|uniref:zinc-dependent alcohol dehydrogenase n=1 Tax=Kribbella antiqua TaxID=2512217 RepID=UPI0013050ED9|nr:alcohol dehydrogenase catalytic domain-containing protein [Kribbella antiqua]
MPVPAAGQVLVEVERVGLCGTDLEEYLDGPIDARPPVILGHEIIGRVAECPGGELAVGTRVVPDVVAGCGTCWWCLRHQPGLCPQLAVLGLQRDGGLAEYMLAEATTCVVIPDDLSPNVAVFAEPAAVAVRALRKAGDLTGARIAVVGLGTIGNLVVQLAAASGAVEVHGIDPSPDRRALAARANFVTAPGLVGQYDVVVECAGTQAAVTSALELTRPGGTVVLVGTGAEQLQFPVRDVVLREKRILGSAAHVWDEDVAAAVALLAREVLEPKPLVSKVIDLDSVVAEGLDALASDPELLKIIVAP